MPSKIFLFFLIFLLILSVSPFLGAFENRIAKADSLFEQGNYTDALSIYTNFFEKTQKASTQMLLKMAFIHEGLEQYTEALYYLSLYYHQHPSFEGLEHMESLAQRQGLKGYEYSELDFFKTFYYRYFEEISLFLLLLGGFCFLILLYILFRTWYVPRYYPILLLCFLVMAFSLIVFTKQPPKAIVFKDQTYLMKAPSAAAEVSNIINKGHKVNILGKQDVWYKLLWNNQTVYVHQDNLHLVF